MTKNLMRRVGVIVLPAVLAVGAVSAIAAAANDSDVIRACVGKNGKTIRLAGANGKCASGETALAWNQKGRVGPAGAAGVAGRDGAAGPAGPAVAQGRRVRAARAPTSSAAIR
jgi:hypothetical protein